MIAFPHGCSAPVFDDDLDVAPLDLSELTPEQRVEIEESLASLAAGRAHLVPHEEVRRALYRA